MSNQKVLNVMETVCNEIINYIYGHLDFLSKLTNGTPLQVSAQNKENPIYEYLLSFPDNSKETLICG